MSSNLSGIDYRWIGRQEYEAALKMQLDLVEARSQGTSPDTVLLLEHEPVYTIGRTRDRSSIESAQSSGLPVVEINRGGQATYHGPGQLTGYLILDLNHYGRDLHHYLRAIEEALISGCRAMDIPADRRDGMTGVWVENRKLASIGVGVRRWVSMHGFAINVSRDVSGFDAIIPCGLQGVSMTSVEQESGKEMSVEAFSDHLRPHLDSALLTLRPAAQP